MNDGGAVAEAQVAAGGSRCDWRAASVDGRWPLERVLFLAIGAVTIIGAALSAFVSEWFLLLVAFVGLNQWLYAAAGTCGSAILFTRLLGFEKASRPTPEGKWPLEKVLFTLAGFMVLLSALLALVVSPWFLALTAFVGLNQLAYAALGACPSSLIIAKAFGVRPGVNAGVESN